MHGKAQARQKKEKKMQSKQITIVPGHCFLIFLTIIFYTAEE
jgi:hypothetical protein